MINHLEGGLGTPAASPHQGRGVPPSPAVVEGGGEGDDTPVLAAAAAAAKREAIAAAVISKRESIEAAALANKQAMASANASPSHTDQPSDSSLLECRRWRRDGTRRRKPKRRGSSGYDSHTLAGTFQTSKLEADFPRLGRRLGRRKRRRRRQQHGVPTPSAGSKRSGRPRSGGQRRTTRSGKQRGMRRGLRAMPTRRDGRKSWHRRCGRRSRRR